MPLSGKQRRYLRGLGHSIDPVVHVGKGGLSDGVVAAVDAALEQHELVKVRVSPDGEDNRHAVAELLAEQTHSDVAQVLGHTVLLYRRHPKEPRIVFPRT